MGNRIYGCDDCLAVCPWNRFADAAAANRAFLPRAELAAPRLADLLALDDAVVPRDVRRIADQAHRGQADDPQLPDRGREQRRSRRLSPSIERALDDPDPVIAEAARWALDQLAAFERGDAGRLIDVGAGRRARVDMGDAKLPLPVDG